MVPPHVRHARYQPTGEGARSQTCVRTFSRAVGAPLEHALARTVIRTYVRFQGGERREPAMIIVENDWVEYAPVPVRPVAVRGGAACAQRTRLVTDRPRAAAPARRPAPVQPASRPAPLPRRQPQPAPRLRLTGRGRLVLVVLPAVLAATTAIVSLTAPLAEAQPARPARTIVVGTGDTLWSIAGRIAPRADPRDVVAELERTNGLTGAAVRAGERLTLPAAVAG